MFNGAKGGRLEIDGTDMDYIRFGKGERTLVIVPGLSDGLKTVKGMAKTMAFMYRAYAKHYRVYVFSRKNRLEPGYTTRDMARDLAKAMDMVGISRAYVKGVSQGGMIAQYLAIDFPGKVEKLVIGVSISRQNPTIQSAVRGWIAMAEADDYRSLAIDSIEKTYTEAWIQKKKYRMMYPIITRVGRPKDLSRFITQAHACIGHDAYDELERISCPTLVIGGDSDDVVGRGTSEETAEKIPGSRLVVLPGLGHGAFTETKDFDREVLAFLS